MIPRGLLLLLILLSGVGGAVALLFDPWLAFALCLSSAVLVLVHFRFGSIVGVLKALGRGDVDGAENLLNGIKRPEWLSKSYRAYYHFAHGLIAYQRGEVELGVVAFQTALATGLPGKYERAITYLNLAHASFKEKDKEQTLEYLEKARADQSDDLFLKQRIEELDKATAEL